MRGALVAIEGVSHSGKGLLGRALRSHYKNTAIFYFPYYSNPVTGQLLQDYEESPGTIECHAVHLLYSANRWESLHAIVGLLERGENVICVGYSHTAISTSVARGVSFEWCRRVETGFLSPDLVICLSVREEVRESRWRQNEEHLRGDLEVDFHRSIKALLDGHAETASWKKIDTSDLAPEDVKNRATGFIDAALLEKRTPVAVMDGLFTPDKDYEETLF